MRDVPAGAELLERFRRWLRDRHVPVTQQRDLVARIVFSAGERLSVEDIQRRLQDRGNKVGTATIYRSLDVMLESGLVRAIDFGEGFRRFETLQSAAHHGHLLCDRCGQVTELATERFERLLPMVADEHGFQHQWHRIEIHGLCADCRGADIGAFTRASPAR